MDDKINITNRLAEIVKHRKTPIVVNKQNTNYIKPKRVSGSFASAGYSDEFDE